MKVLLVTTLTQADPGEIFGSAALATLAILFVLWIVAWWIVAGLFGHSLQSKRVAAALESIHADVERLARSQADRRSQVTGEPSYPDDAPGAPDAPQIEPAPSGMSEEGSYGRSIPLLERWKSLEPWQQAVYIGSAVLVGLVLAIVFVALL